MSLLRTKQKQIERRKRYLFLSVGAAGIISSVFLNLWLGLPLISLSAYLGLDWFKFRCKFSMRF